MTTSHERWNTIHTTYTESVSTNVLSEDQLTKIDELVLNEDIEHIHNGLTLLTTLAPEYLCRYLKQDGESVVLRDAGRFCNALLAERALVNAVKGEPMWQGLFESGAFESMHFRSLGDVSVENLTADEKSFCVRMAKEMVLIPKGDFMMGGLEDDEDADDIEKPRHKVTLTRDFLMGKYPVTQALWESVMGSNPSHFKGANRPVETVSWLDVVAFGNKLSEREGLEPVYSGLGGYQLSHKFGDEDWLGNSKKATKLSKKISVSATANGYRLPTEAEWEYSARANQSFKYSGSDNVDEVAWYDDNSGYETHPVGQKKPNGFGLYDMSGNVAEWVWDWYGDYSSQSDSDLVGPNRGLYRVYRGGSWNHFAGYARISTRYEDCPDLERRDLGFRPGRTT